MTVFIGVDPGKVSGLARYDSRSRNFVAYALRGVKAVGDQLREEITQARAARQNIMMSCERFTMGGNQVLTAQPDALEAIGVVKWLACDLHVPLKMSGAAEGARIAPRALLVKLGWWTVADLDQQRNKATAQVALAMLHTDPKAWYDLSR